jgi:hypothetical protein
MQQVKVVGIRVIILKQVACLLQDIVQLLTNAVPGIVIYRFTHACCS